MIKQVYSDSPWLDTYSSAGNQPYLPMGSSSPLVGTVAWSSSKHRIEVYDGSAWHELGGGYATVGPSHRATTVLEWAEKKMLEEQALDRRLSQHPGLRDAYERFLIMDRLTQQEEQQEPA